MATGLEGFSRSWGFAHLIDTVDSVKSNAGIRVEHLGFGFGCSGLGVRGQAPKVDLWLL